MTKELSPELLQILVCPLCKGDLTYDRENSELLCYESKLAYQINEGVPNLLVDEARKLN